MSDAQRPRVRPWLRYTAIAACLILLPLAAHGLWDYLEARRLSTVIEGIRGRGEPVYYTGYVARTLTDQEQRSARYYSAAALLARGATSIKLKEVNDAIAAIAETTPSEAARDARLSRLQHVLDDYAPMLDLLDRAAALDTGGVQANDELRYTVPNVDLANVNAVRIARASFLGDTATATKALSETLKLRNVSFLWPVGIDTGPSLRLLLMFAPPDTDTLAALQAQYQGVLDDKEVERDLLRSRARFITNVWPAAPAPMSVLPRVGGIGPRQSLIDVIVRPRSTRFVRQRILEYEEALPVARQPWPARFEMALALGKKYPDPPTVRTGGLTTALAPTMSWPAVNVAVMELVGLTRRTARDAAWQRVALATLAIERFRRAHADALPESLETLVPQYLSGVPADPYTGAPLKYARSERGYKVYSVGFNRTDEGGDWSDVEPRSTRVPGWPISPKDIGIDIRKF